MFIKNLAEIIWLFLFIFLTIAVMPVFLMLIGQESLAKGIHSVYRASCHQRVERTPFFFGVEGFINFYSIDDLQYYGVLPDKNPNVPEVHAEDIFGYPYIGDEVVGYKPALCIRDLAIYTSILITGAIYLVWVDRKKKVVKFDWKIILLLMIPMMVDGTFQLFAEIFRWEWVPDIYFANNWKRIITGAMFGVGFALLVFPNLKESSQLWYNKGENKPSGESQEKKKDEGET